MRLIIRISLNHDTASRVRNWLKAQWAPNVRQVRVPGTQRTTGTWEGNNLSAAEVSAAVQALMTVVANPSGVVQGANANVAFDHVWVYADNF